MGARIPASRVSLLPTAGTADNDNRASVGVNFIIDCFRRTNK
ncbi:hypothetical protein RCH11_001706 [Glaciihabitans sp. GrIS 2.15]|nr:hypothetical protein [Glaciihabitans sp. GrIS 2.15]